MAVLPDYVSGTITVTQGDVNFTGTNTLWRTMGFREGDTVQLQGFTAIIKGTSEFGNPIDSNVAGQFVEPWPGQSGTFTYRMRFLPDGVRFAGKSTNLIELLGNGVLSNLAELGVENGKVPVGNDAGQYELKPTSGFGIQDPNGTLAKFAALTTEANKVFATNGTSYPILATIAAILGYTPADRACGTFTGNVTIAPTGGNGQVRVSIGGTNYNWFNQSQIALRNNTTGVYSYLNGNQVWLLRNGGMQIDLGDFSMTQGLINSIFNGNGTRIR